MRDRGRVGLALAARARAGDSPAADTAAPQTPGSDVATGLARADGPTPGRALLLFLVLAALLTFVVAASLVLLPYTAQHGRPTFFRRQPWFDGWFRWDGAWYLNIAERGYWEYSTTTQSPVAYFPAYPLLMRWLMGVFGNAVVAGIAITIASGAAAAVMFSHWARERLEGRAAWTALLLLLLYPFAYYLYGAVYADALFLASMLGAFLLLERDHPVLSGLVAAVGTAARPVGAVVVVALIVRAIELRGGFSKLRGRDAGLLLANLGVGGYCVYTWQRFGEPLAFIKAQTGWEQEPGPATWFKTEFLRGLEMFSHNAHDLIAYLLHPTTTIICLALVPLIGRRFGWGYAVYVALVIGLSAVSTKNFFGMGRYGLAAFPCFAAAGILLSTRPRLTAAILGIGGALMVAGASYFARGFYLS